MILAAGGVARPVSSCDFGLIEMIQITSSCRGADKGNPLSLLLLGLKLFLLFYSRVGEWRRESKVTDSLDSWLCGWPEFCS